MPTPILATQQYIPGPQPNVVSRPRLIERLNEGLHRNLTLISAPTGFGKTTRISAWVKNPVVDMPDADMEMGTRIIADLSFGCAVQRCLATSVTITVWEAVITLHLPRSKRRDV